MMNHNNHNTENNNNNSKSNSNSNSKKVLVNCFYYSFYIDSDELKSKYNLTEEKVVKEVQNVIKKNSGEQLKKTHRIIDINSNNAFDSFSNIFTSNKSKILEKRKFENIENIEKTNKNNKINEILKIKVSISKYYLY